MTDPTDESGWCLSTLHEFPDATFTHASGLAATDEFLYLAGGPTGVEVGRLDLSDWTLDDDWAICGDAVGGIAITSDGHLIVLAGFDSVTKVDPDGTVHDGYGTLPTGWGWSFYCSMGGDGLVYAVVFDDDGYYSVVSIDPSDGTITDIAGLHLATFDEWYTSATADGSGVVWAAYRTVSDTDNVLRSWNGTTATDHILQPIEAPLSEDSNLRPALQCDADGKVIAPMVTFQEALHRYASASTFNILWQPGAGVTSPSWTGTTTDCTYVEGGPDTSVRYLPDAGASSYSVKFTPLDWLNLYRGAHSRASLGFAGVTGQTITLSIIDAFTNAVLATSGPVTDEIDTLITYDTDASIPEIALLVEVALDSGTYAGLDAEIIEIELNLAFRQPAPNLAWFLHVDDGTPTRIAGTWDYTGSPGPATSELDFGNLADGPLGTSLANSAGGNGGAVGMSADLTTLYFIDDSTPIPPPDGTVVSHNLLRRLARCAAAGRFQLGFVAFRSP